MDQSVAFMSFIGFLHHNFGFKRTAYFESLFDKISISESVADSDFDKIFPEDVQSFTRLHFSPIEISKHAIRFLTSHNPKTKILDIGSGSGKFCMVGSVSSAAYFTGVEQRESLHNQAIQLMEEYQIPRCEFILGNIVDLSFSNYDAFYMFNSFYENLSYDENITDEISLRQPNYDLYSNYVKQQLERMPIGTKLATYFCGRSIAPDTYELIADDFNGNLKLWEKVR